MPAEPKPEIKDGLSQSERHLSSLDADYFSIDEKDTTDLLKLIVDLSGQFNYYNFSNNIEGDWKAFLTSDIDIVIALLSKFDSSSLTDQYKQLTDTLSNAENETEIAGGLKNIFEFIHDLAVLQINYHKAFETAAHPSHEIDFGAVLQNLRHLLEKLYMYNVYAAALLGEEVKISFYQEGRRINYEESPEPAENPFDHRGSGYEKVLLARPFFDRMIFDLQTWFAGLLRTSRTCLKEQRFEGDVYEPHVALLVAFLHLFTYVQKQVNRLMEKHLDYYYQEIIGIKKQPEIPDKLHLVLEPVALTGSFTVPKGEMVFAEAGENQDKILYALESDVHVSGAEVKELRTLFVSNKSQVKGQQSSAHDVKELQVYTGEYAVHHPSAFLKEKTGYTPWPVLGEDQAELPQRKRTMKAADIGLLVASPLLFATDGKRDFQLKFLIQEEAFNRFRTHVDNLSLASGISPDVLFLEMLNQSFIIALTGGSGWIDIEDYAVSCPTDPASGSFIEIKFRLEPTDEPVATYSPAIHGYDCGVAWPVLRLLLNNASFHNPYTFLSYFLIERINIKVDVKESQSLKLKNNLGELYAGSPFQPFGPVPAVGSYLDMKNTNIFNRYTTSLRLQLHWFDLPKEEGGFTQYYEGYDDGFTNESFKVQLNSSVDAKVSPGPDERQEFALFESENGKGRLKPGTAFKDIDFRRIRFDNGMRLQHERGDTDSYFKQGAVRLELTAPQEAFGHRLYPQVFTDAVMNNARRFARKQAMPNPAYVPVIRALSIDYTLEHAEVTNGATDSQEEEEVVLIHIHPFGYHTFYTGKNSEQNYFVPPPDQESNLFIGLTGLVAGHELSLLFQLAEENFHHTVRDPEEISWSHLVGNRWVPFPKSSVLQDTTNNFINSGMLTLRIPDDIENNNTILPAGLYWLGASLPGESSVRSKMIALFAQAAIAGRVPGQPLPTAYSYTLAAGQIKGLQGRENKIQAVRQLFPSFNGQPAESSAKYNVRVSERLRHRHRFLSTLDIAQAVLNAFPEILMVKCYCADGDSSMMLPGVDVHVVVIPREREDGSFTSRRPMVNLSSLYQIKKFLTRSVAGFVKVEVGNPVYEKVMVVASVQFKNPLQAPQSNGYYLKLINQDIQQCIASWLCDSKGSFRIGAGIYVSEVLSYLQNRDYIEYITGFSMVHFYHVWDKIERNFHAQVTDTSVEKVESLRGSVPAAILIPADEHLITVIDRSVPKEAAPAGIGEFSIGSGLLIGKPAAPAVQLPSAASPAEELYDFTVYND